MFARSSRQVLAATAIGLTVRLALAPFTGHPWDMRIWLDVGQRTVELHQNIYSIGSQTHWVWGYYAYPPAWLAWLAVAYYFASDSYAYALVLKLPIVLADLLTAITVFGIVARYNSRENAVTAFALYFLNPLVILIGAVWGMFDSIAVLFATLSLYWLLEDKPWRSALALGFGILVKIYPILILPMILFELKHIRKASTAAVSGFALLAVLPTAVFSAPFFALDWASYVSGFAGHGSPSGWLTYWLFLTKVSVIFVKSAPFAFLVLFAVAYLIFIRKARTFSHWTVDDVALPIIGILVSFMLSSPKVNVQYFLWLLPLLVVHTFATGKRIGRDLLIALTALGVGVVIAALPVNRFFVLGLKMYVDAWLISLAAVTIIVISALTPFTFFSYLASYFGGRDRLVHLRIGRATVATLMIIVAIIAISPMPNATTVGPVQHLLALPESPAAGFDLFAKELGVPQFLEKFHPTAVALLFGPDFANTYTGYRSGERVTDFFKVRYYDDWTLRDIRELVKALHDRDVTVYLGLSLRAFQLVGNKGYSSQWLAEIHPEVVRGEFAEVGATLKTDPGWGILETTTYSRYLTKQASRIINELDFDGLLVSEVPMSSLGDGVAAFAQISNAMKGMGKSAILSVNAETDLPLFKELLTAFDFVVLSTSPWRDGVFFPNPDRSIDHYSRLVDSIRSSLQPQEFRKVLGVLEMMDEQQGWVVPYSFFIFEETARTSWRLSGYVIEFANKYSPYSIRSS